MIPADRTLRDARLVARQLVGEDPRPEECARWADAIAAVSLEHDRDRRLWAVAMRSPLWLGLVDAGLALADPYSPVRRRVCLMLAILEASPAHVECFEARDLPARAFLGLAARGALAVVRAACGLALVRSWGMLWR